MSETERLTRSLVRVVKVAGDTVVVQVPAFGSRRKDRAVIHKASLPEEILAVCEAGPTDSNPGPYLHARVNIGAGLVDDLRFEDWEVS